MAYNVFKRPMFKRGGSTTGTGIMSHVESKTIGGGAISGNNMSNNRTGFQAPILTIGEGMASEMARGKPGFSSPPFSQYSSPIGPTRTGFQAALTRFPRALPLGLYGAGAGVGIGLGGLLDFYAQSTKTPEQMRRIKEMSEFGIMDETNLDVGEAMKYIEEGGKIGEAPGFFPRGGKEKFFKEKGLDPNTGLPIEKKIEETIVEEKEKPIVDQIEIPELKEKPTEEQPKTFEDTYETEKKRIEKLIGDDDNKGMVAIALSKAIGTPGTIADKAAALNDQLLGIMKGKKADKRDIAKLAYTATKEIEKAKIAAGKESYSERMANEVRKYQTTLRDSKASKEAKDYAQEQLSILKSTIDIISPKAREGLTSTDTALLAGLEKAADKVKRLSKDPTSTAYKNALDEYNLARVAVSKNPSLLDFIELADAQIKAAQGLKDGGRVNRAMGTPESGETPTAPVQKLSFAELRNRLPKEITDDVIRLISSSEEALQDFAYIRTQGDVNKFNMKYGVNAVLPAQA
jgi:hypothetical protein